MFSLTFFDRTWFGRQPQGLLHQVSLLRGHVSSSSLPSAAAIALIVRRPNRLANKTVSCVLSPVPVQQVASRSGSKNAPSETGLPNPGTAERVFAGILEMWQNRRESRQPNCIDSKGLQAWSRVPPVSERMNPECKQLLRATRGDLHPLTVCSLHTTLPLACAWVWLTSAASQMTTCSSCC